MREARLMGLGSRSTLSSKLSEAGVMYNHSSPWERRFNGADTESGSLPMMSFAVSSENRLSSSTPSAATRQI